MMLGSRAPSERMDSIPSANGARQEYLQEEAAMMRIGLVDCDTSHVVEFTRRLNHVGIAQDQWIDGAQVVAAVPGTSFISPERIPGHVHQLQDYGITIVDHPSDLLGHIDAVMIESVDGGLHLEP